MPETPQAARHTRAKVSNRIPQKLVQRVCIWFCLKQGFSATATNARLQRTFPGSCYSRASVFRWFKDYQSGREKLGNNAKGGKRTARTAEKVQACKDIVNRDNSKNIDQMSTELGISYGSVQRLLKVDLKLKKRACRLVPHLLTDRDRQQRMNFAISLLRAHAQNLEVLNWVVTMDESWFHVYDPGSKVENMRWMAAGEERPEIVQREMSVKKTMFIPFFDCRGLLYWEFFENGTISKEVFKPLLARVRAVIRNRHGVQVWRRRDEYHLHMDNALCHRSRMVRRSLEAWDWPVMSHPPYSPDLSPADFFLFPYLKRRLRGNNFQTVDNLENAIQRELNLITAAQWDACFQNWLHRCLRCMEYDGGYFEGKKEHPDAV